MNDPFIRTVLGDIAPEAFGVCDAHEHLIIDDPYVHETWPDRKLDNVIKAVGELTTFKELGGSALVDTMPMACGRNIEKLVQIARETNVHVVAATGLHLEKYYRPNHWLDGFDAGDLVEFFVADIERGIPADESQPPATRTDHRAGIIKVAGQQHLTHRQRTAFFAAAEAHRRTGCPIVTHTDGGHNAIDQVDLLLNHGVQPNKITLSHVDRIAAPEQHRQLLNFGVNLTYDAAFRWPPEYEPNPSVHLIATLLPEFPTQIMVGMDAASTRYWRSYGGSPGLEWLVTRLRRLLEQSEVDEVLLHRLYVDNPANAFAFG
ncbi:MAG: hypothetical protein WD294_13535 [Phycisphaeraceae bacterium]